MCGISGFFQSNTLDHRFIDVMAENLSHRGPDNTGYFHDECISMAHNRLSIIDLSERANQPFTSSNNNLVMVYNGEVYNFEEIKDELGIKTSTSSDTEVILEAYQRWGDSFVDKLNGMFAIAIYNKESKSLNLWRDRFGIKPLYYFWDGRNFAFASELKALYSLPLKRELNLNSIKDYLFLEYIPQPNTAFKNFFKLGHGETLKVSNGKIQIKKYYSILNKIDSNETYSESEYLKEFESLFHSSLNYQSISDVPIGAFLSGGLDSSSVCAGLKKLNSDLSTFNIGFNEKKYDESTYANRVAEQLDTNHTSQMYHSSDLLESMDYLMKQYDEPFAVSSVFPTYKVCQSAKKDITVALSGDGGDELFMGYGHYEWYNRLSKLDSGIGKIFRNISSKTLPYLPTKYARVASLLNYDNIKSDWPHIWSQEQYMFRENEISAITGGNYKNEALRDSWNKISLASSDPYQRISLFDIQHYLPDDLLYKVDMASMANSLEVRLPFLDHRLVEFAINMPTRLKYKKGHQKLILRKYLKSKISNDLIERQKWGFGSPVDQWIKSDLKPLLHELLSKKAIKDTGVFDPVVVKKKIDEFEKGKNYEYKKLWALLTFQSWHKNYC